MIEISKTNLEGVLLIKPFVFEDHRGEYVETYNEQLYKNNGIGVKFVQDDISVCFFPSFLYFTIYSCLNSKHLAQFF